MKRIPAIPVIGPLLYRRSVRALARAAKSGDLIAVRELSGIAVASPDAPSRRIALDALGALPSQDAIDAFCNEVLAAGNPNLEETAVRCGYAPTKPERKALFLYYTGQDDAFYRFDPAPHHPLLAHGYAAAPAGHRARVLRSVSGTRRGDCLARALLGTDPMPAAGTWTPCEWELVLSALTAAGAWEELWRLVVASPPSPALRVLNTLKDSGWRPGGDERPVFDTLIGNLPAAWTFPAPEKPEMTAGIPESRGLRLAFSRDGTLLATGTSNGEVTVWQVASARLVASTRTGAGAIRFLAFTPDNTCVIAGGDTGTVHGAAIPSGDITWSFADDEHPLSSIIMSDDGEMLITGDRNGGIVHIGCRTGRTLRVVPGHSSPVTALAAGPGGVYVATGHADGTVCCRDTGAAAWTVPGTGNAVRALALTGEGDRLFVVHDHSLPVLRDGRSGDLVQAYAGFSGHPACHAFAADRQMAAIGSDDRVLRLWNWPDTQPAAEVPFYNRLPTCCAIAPDGALLAAGCNEGTVYFFSIPEGLPVKEFREYRRPVTACAISPDSALLATAGGDGTVAIRSIPAGELLRTLRRPAGGITAIASGAGGATIIAGTADGMLRIFSREDGTLARSIDMYAPSVRAVAVSDDGLYLACAGSDTSLRIWNLATGSLTATCEGLKTTVRCLSFLPGDGTCVSCGWDGVVRCWEVPSGSPSGLLAGHTSIITCCCPDPEGRFLVTGSNDTTVRIWHPAGGKECVVIKDAACEVRSCAISPDGSLLATAGPEPVIRLYYLPEGTDAGTIPQVPKNPSALAFSDDGLVLAAGYDSGILAFYAVHERSLVRTLPAHAGAVTGIVAVRGRDRIVTGGMDGMIRTWHLPFLRPLSRTTLADLAGARAQAQKAGPCSVAEQWRFLACLLALRFQSEIELCPAFCDAGQYDIQIVG
jgi:WD40 repeat protein